MDLCDFRAGDVDFVGFDIAAGESGGGKGEEVVDLVPGQPFIAGDVEVFADGTAVSKEAVEAFGEVGVVGESPERCSVAGDADGLIIENAVEDGISGIEREEGFVVGVGRADNGDGEFFFAVSAGEAILARDFVARVFPEWIIEGGGFADGKDAGRGLVGRCARDENVLVGFAPEQVEIAFDLVGGKDDPVDDGVPVVIFEQGFGFIDVAGDGFCAFGDGAGALSSGEEVEFDALLNRELGTCRGDDAGSADKEDFHFA